MLDEMPTTLARPPREAPPPCEPPRPEMAGAAYFVAGRIVSCPPTKPKPEPH